MVLEHDETRRGPVLVVELSRMEALPKKINLFDGRAVRHLAEDIIDHYNGSPELQKDTDVVMQHIPNDLAMTVIDQAACCRRTITEGQAANVAALLTHKEISDAILLSCIRGWWLYIEQPLVSAALVANAAAAYDRLYQSTRDGIPEYYTSIRWEWGKPDIAATGYPKGGIIPPAVSS